MKKFLIALITLVALSTAVFAGGPLLGVAITPINGQNSMLTFGYDFGDVNLEIQKDDLSTPFLLWNSAVMWTPRLPDGFGYRAGAKLTMNYAQIRNTNTGRLQYNQFSFALGVSKTWGPLQLYGDLNLSPRGAGNLIVLPVIGVNFLFGDLIPDVSI